MPKSMHSYRSVDDYDADDDNAAAERRERDDTYSSTTPTSPTLTFSALRQMRASDTDLTRSILVNRANTVRARALSPGFTAALCTARAGQVLYAMSATDTCWLAHAASLTIRFSGVDIADRLKISQDYGLISHLDVVALG